MNILFKVLKIEIEVFLKKNILNGNNQNQKKINNLFNIRININKKEKM